MHGIHRVKQWCRTRIRNAGGVHEVHQRLAHQSALLEQMKHLLATANHTASEAFAAANACRGLPNLSETETLGSQQLAPTSQRGVFVFGSARSGTSILTEALNCSPDVLVLVEAVLFMHEQTADVIEAFNAMHARFHSTRTKGAYLPPGLVARGGPLALIQRLADDFDYVGEKVAIGPGPYWVNARSALVDFHARHFFRSHYLLTARAPLECMLSIHNLFPSEPLESVFHCWLTGIETCIDAYRILPNSRWLFFEDLNADLVRRATAELGISLPIPPALFSPDCIVTRVSRDRLPSFFQGCEELCATCTGIYERLKAGICPDELVCHASEGSSRFFNGILAMCDVARAQLLALDQRGEVRD